mmetsp:Transcript_13431/g.31621  ORF Transcript_13431/g.31621 Transcript_13431/m.31621 type:complete len:478 (+) Transcript_13431:304-1737(+)|eukprot:CAMPEP_0197186570 /NCGR_PEP_ID=MMETSP1423-20130617/14205_1 /TAXON_ID=476441 /ORGANISM="Pseudo-nitzschia heimii, Strain UNC1101" /LENGTH=477 /DNA_ID=CAMNT_0042637923 /DNA_START=223 /DNA_END=1656 /DNA_ORIENTATION=-
MNRKSFLSCQSFLCPFTPSSVQDDYDLLSRNDLKPNTTKFCQEILFDCASLSIEPCENTGFHIDRMKNEYECMPNKNQCNIGAEGDIIGPAYFLPQKNMAINNSTDKKVQNSIRTKNSVINRDNSGMLSNDSNDTKFDSARIDPTLCKIKLILQTANPSMNVMTTPIEKRNKREISESEGEIERKEEAILIANIENDHFQIDLKQIHNICIGQSEVNRPLLCKDSNPKKSETSVSKSSSFLMLQFPSCCFRIYRFKPSMCDKEIGSKNHDCTTTFNAVRSRLENIISSNSLLPFPLGYSDVTAFSGKNFKSDVTRKYTNDGNYNDSLGCSRRCLRSYTQSWKDLILFDNILENSYSEISNRSMKENKFKHTVNHLMKRIPEQVSLSFIKGEQWRKALESYENEIARKIRDVDGIIDDFWNDSSDQNKRRKRKRNNKAAERWKSKSPNDDALLFTNILEEHKKCIISKHELYLLPRRG